MIIPSPSVAGDLGRPYRFDSEFPLSCFLFKSFCAEIWILQIVTEPCERGVDILRLVLTLVQKLAAPLQTEIVVDKSDEAHVMHQTLR